MTENGDINPEIEPYFEKRLVLEHFDVTRKATSMKEKLSLSAVMREMFIKLDEQPNGPILLLPFSLYTDYVVELAGLCQGIKVHRGVNGGVLFMNRECLIGNYMHSSEAAHFSNEQLDEGFDHVFEQSGTEVFRASLPPCDTDILEVIENEARNLADAVHEMALKEIERPMTNELGIFSRGVKYVPEFFKGETHDRTN